MVNGGIDGYVDAKIEGKSDGVGGGIWWWWQAMEKKQKLKNETRYLFSNNKYSKKHIT